MNKIIKFISVLLFIQFNTPVYGQCKISECDLVAHIPDNDIFSEPAISAFENITLESNVTVKESQEKFGFISSFGKSTEIGENTKVGGVYSAQDLLLKNLSSVSDVIYAGFIQREGMVSTPENINHPDHTHLSLHWSVSFPDSRQNSIICQDNSAKPVTPGYYKSLVVKTGCTAQLATGTYFFDELITEKNSVLHMDNKNGTLVIHVREKLQHLGSFHYLFEQSDLILSYFGKQPVELMSVFDASLIAPNASVIFYPQKNVAHKGIFYAGNILIKSDTIIERTPISRRGPEIAKFKPRIEEFPKQIDTFIEDTAAADQTPPFSNSEIGRLLNEHFEKMYAYGPNADTEYEESLQKLRENAPAAISELYSTYEATPKTIETQLRRLTIVDIMRSIEHDSALAPLTEIAESAIDPNIAALPKNHYQRPTMLEDIIKMRAVKGIGRLAAMGNAEVENTLVNIMLDDHELNRIYAAVEYMAVDNTPSRRDNLRASLPENLHYLLNIDTNPIDEIHADQ